ncbi:MAG: ChaN family lipoprotein [Candidatus Aminicenantes bacterium]|nr:ChaN family lipoprotein [Acidobacteriota bacterium]MCG2810828.1 ChaN family lipoprotein [Candidatus Aminicenantes bacterium]
MKNMHLLVLSLLMVLLPIAAWTASESALDQLPIGASPRRLDLAVLPAGQVMDTASGLEISLPDLVRQNLDRDVFIIGEYHDSYACHVWQKEFIEALAKETPRLLVGFEFFNRGDDPVLDLYLSGKISEAELLQKTGWYQRGAMNFAYTRLVLQTVKKLGLKAVGLNVPRELVSKVAKRGWAGLSAAEQALFPGAGRSHPEHEYFVRSTLGEFAVQVPLWFRNVYAAQKCWDTVMAESMRLALARPEFRGRKGIIIAGSAHVAYGLGIPWRYRLRDKRAKIFTLVPVTVTPKKSEASEEENLMVKALAGQLKPAAVFSRGLADAVFAVAAEEKPYFAEAGFSGKVNAEGLYVVERVGKASPAEKCGLKKGDFILAVDGVPFKSLEGLRLVLAQKDWGDALELDVRKKVPLARE